MNNMSQKARNIITTFPSQQLGKFCKKPVNYYNNKYWRSSYNLSADTRGARYRRKLVVLGRHAIEIQAKECNSLLRVARCIIGPEGGVTYSIEKVLRDDNDMSKMTPTTQHANYWSIRSSMTRAKNYKVQTDIVGERGSCPRSIIKQIV